MGYYSQVAVAISKEIIDTLNVLGEPLPELLKDADVVSERHTFIIYMFESIKWYSTYHDVVELDEFLQHYVDKGVEDEKDYVAMLRLGEELGDVEELGSPWEFDMSVRQEICF